MPTGDSPRLPIRRRAPAINAKLAAKASANVVLVNVDVAFWNLQRLSVLAGKSGYVLGGDVGEEMIVVSPLGDGAVAFKAAMRDHRTAVDAFRNNFGFFEASVGIAFDQLCFFLKR